MWKDVWFDKAITVKVLQNECTRKKVKCLTRRIDGWLGVAVISAGQGKLTLKNILQSQAEKTFDLVVGFKTAGKDKSINPR